MINRLLHYIKLLKNPNYWTWSNIKGVFQAYFRKTKMYMGFKVPIHIYEQYRYREIAAKKCIENITCLNCNCYIKEKILEDRGCSILEGKGELVGKQAPCYPDLMDAPSWKQYKKQNNIWIQ